MTPTQTVDLILVGISFFFSVIVAIWVGLGHDPRIRALENEIEHAYYVHTTPSERAMISTFVTAIKPQLQETATKVGMDIEKMALGEAVGFAKDHQLTVTPAEIVAAVRTGLSQSVVQSGVKLADAAAKEVK